LALAWQQGIRPISLENLLNYLGYHYSIHPVGRLEAADQTAIKSITNPSGVKGKLQGDTVPRIPETAPPSSDDNPFGPDPK
jgi:hypothetical protein